MEFGAIQPCLQFSQSPKCPRSPLHPLQSSSFPFSFPNLPSHNPWLPASLSSLSPPDSPSPASPESMYLSEQPRPVDMMLGVAGAGVLPPPQQPLLMPADSSGGEDHEIKAPKKRAETWVQEETRSLIAFRREMDGLFNTSKSNKHLWEQISAKMRDKGFDRSATMCTDKWRNLLKEFKKARHRGGGTPKMSYFKELDELLKERSRNGAYKNTSSSKVDPYLQFADKGLEDASIPFGPVEASGRSELNLERSLDHDVHTLAITASDPVTANGVPPWNWRDNSTNGGDNNGSYGGRVILVKCGEFARKIGIDGTADAIKEAIKSGFGLRTKRAFWLEDEDEVIRSLDREMPLGTYTLHLDEGVTIKVCTYDESDRVTVHTEEKTFFTEEEFRDFLSRRCWTGLRELSGFRTVDSLEELRQGAIYQEVRPSEE